jgi:hypothetical protein
VRLHFHFRPCALEPIFLLCERMITQKGARPGEKMRPSGGATGGRAISQLRADYNECKRAWF